MIWIEYQFHDFNVFPNYDGAHFSSSIFLPTVITVFKRLVRPYAHVLCHHLDDLEMANFKINFLNGLLYFIEFLKENHVVDVKYMRPVTINLEWNNFVNSLKH